MRRLACIFMFSALALGGAERTVVILGEISDSQCAFNVHSSGSSHDDALKSDVLGHTPEECARNCVRMGGKYVLVDQVHKKVYHLANPERVQPFAAKKVRVKATLSDSGILSITSIDPR